MGKTLADLRRVTGDETFFPCTPYDITSRPHYTCHMGTENSSVETRSRARRFAETLGAYHSDTSIDGAIHSLLLKIRLL